MARARTGRRVLIVGADGLRPDMVDPALMPTYAGLVARGTRFAEHHAVYPTHTRVNIATLATGRSPGGHGIVANVMRVPGATPDGIVDTGDYTHLEALDRVTDGRALLVPALGDLLAEHGGRVAVAATSSGGGAILWTRNQPYRVVTTNSTFGRADLYSLRAKLGEVPSADLPTKIPHLAYTARAVTDIFLDDAENRVIVLWLSEPDTSLHWHGLGAPEVRDALAACDAALAHVLAALDRRGLRDQFDLFLVSDHGHSTVRAHRTLGEYLDRARVALDGRLPRLLTASDYAYADPADVRPTAGDVAPVIRWVQAQPWAGAVFGGLPEVAALPGVLPLAAAWNGRLNDRAPLFAVSPRWTNEKNAHGVPGTVAALTEQGALRSTHGSASPWDLHAFAVAVGPSFREGVTSELPSGAADLVPTVLAVLGIERPGGLDGRVLWEAFAQPATDPGEAVEEMVEPQTPDPEGFAPSLRLHRIGRSAYLHEASNGR